MVVCSWLLTQQVLAAPVVNEVLANEPGRYTSLEWIELYNDSISAVSLTGYQLDINGAIVTFPDSLLFDSGSYFIVCRRLYALGDSPGFESFWGDNSGVWGDCPEESAVATPLEASFSLTNESGSVTLLDGDSIVSSFQWTATGLDGYSWERVVPDQSPVEQSNDFTGSTPGFLNSVTPVARDLRLDSISVSTLNNICRVVYTLSNPGFEPVADAYLYLYGRDTSEADALGDTLDVIPIPAMEVGGSIEIEGLYEPPQTYLPVAAVLSDDDRNRNNRRDFVIVGSTYRSLMLSELMANPETPLECEWVELQNGADTAVNLANWSFGDNLKTYKITEDSLTVASGEFIVLTQSLAAFTAYYAGKSVRCVEPSSWPSFNDDGDQVRLIDPNGVMIDCFDYDHTFDNNYSWSRSEAGGALSQWGRSGDIGGTPGYTNTVLLEPTASLLAVTVEPAYVSPDGDGFEDFVTVTVDAPPAENYTVRIYDRRGRSVRTIFDNEPLIPGQFEWNGLSDTGQRLPIGLYLLYVEAAGVGSAKKPIVVAR